MLIDELVGGGVRAQRVNVHSVLLSCNSNPPMGNNGNLNLSMEDLTICSTEGSGICTFPSICKIEEGSRLFL